MFESIVGGNNDEGNVLQVRLDLDVIEDFLTIDFGQEDVEQDQFRGVAIEQFDGLGTVCRVDDFEASALQYRLIDDTQGKFIFDN